MFVPAITNSLITIDRISRDYWVQEFHYDRKYDRILSDSFLFKIKNQNCDWRFRTLIFKVLELKLQIVKNKFRKVHCNWDLSFRSDFNVLRTTPNIADLRISSSSYIWFFYEIFLFLEDQIVIMNPWTRILLDSKNRIFRLLPGNAND